MRPLWERASVDGAGQAAVFQPDASGTFPIMFYTLVVISYRPFLQSFGQIKILDRGWSCNESTTNVIVYSIYRMFLTTAWKCGSPVLLSCLWSSWSSHWLLALQVLRRREELLMSQMENMAVPAVGNMSKEELWSWKSYECKRLLQREGQEQQHPCYGQMWCLQFWSNIVYAISIAALMLSSELFTTELNSFPKNPTFSNFINAFHRSTFSDSYWILSWRDAYYRTDHYLFSCCFQCFSSNSAKRCILFMVVMATMMVPERQRSFPTTWRYQAGEALIFTAIDRAYLTSAMGNFLPPSFTWLPDSLYESAKLTAAIWKFYRKDPASADKIRYRRYGSVYLINAWNKSAWSCCL